MTPPVLASHGLDWTEPHVFSSAQVGRRRFYPFDKSHGSSTRRWNVESQVPTCGILPRATNRIKVSPYRDDTRFPKRWRREQWFRCWVEDIYKREFTTHLEETLPEWRDKFLCYKPLKKLLKRFPPSSSAAAAADASLPPHLDLAPDPDPNPNPNRGGPDPGDDVGRGGGGGNDAVGGALVDLQEWFVSILNEELDKFNDFYVDKEEEFVIRFQELKERIEQVKEKSSKAGTSTSKTPLILQALLRS
ncbi:hypothetical protein NL676_014862 [Syzygium grande]|nr:hypothetical protein NL676_014862 [Syzygium grande]